MIKPTTLSTPRRQFESLDAKKRVLLFAVLALFARTATAQQSSSAVFKNSGEYLRSDTKTDIQDAYLNSNNTLVVVASDGEKRKVSRRDAWGYRAKDGTAFRLTKDETYKVLESGGLTIYSAPTTAIVGDLMYNDKQFYFSDGLDGSVHKLEYSELRKVFEARNPAFIASVKEELRDKDLWARNDAGFVLVELYNASAK